MEAKLSSVSKRYFLAQFLRERRELYLKNIIRIINYKAKRYITAVTAFIDIIENGVQPNIVEGPWYLRCGGKSSKWFTLSSRTFGVELEHILTYTITCITYTRQQGHKSLMCLWLIWSKYLHPGSKILRKNFPEFVMEFGCPHTFGNVEYFPFYKFLSQSKIVYMYILIFMFSYR